MQSCAFDSLPLALRASLWLLLRFAALRLISPCLAFARYIFQRPASVLLRGRASENHLKQNELGAAGTPRFWQNAALTVIDRLQGPALNVL
jgi:hypothetical protein